MLPLQVDDSSTSGMTNTLSKMMEEEKARVAERAHQECMDIERRFSLFQSTLETERSNFAATQQRLESALTERELELKLVKEGGSKLKKEHDTLAHEFSKFREAHMQISNDFEETRKQLSMTLVQVSNSIAEANTARMETIKAKQDLSTIKSNLAKLHIFYDDNLNNLAFGPCWAWILPLTEMDDSAASDFTLEAVQGALDKLEENLAANTSVNASGLLAARAERDKFAQELSVTKSQLQDASAASSISASTITRLRAKALKMENKVDSINAELLTALAEQDHLVKDLAATKHKLQASAVETQNLRIIDSETKTKLASTESKVRALESERTRLEEALVVSEQRTTTASSTSSAKIRELETEVSRGKTELRLKDSALRAARLERRDPPFGSPTSTSMHIDMLETKLALQNLKSEVRKTLEWCQVKKRDWDWKTAEEGIEPYKDELKALSTRCCALAGYEAECMKLRSSRAKLRAEIRDLKEGVEEADDTVQSQSGESSRLGRPPKASHSHSHSNSKQVSDLKMEIVRLQRQLVSIPASSFWSASANPLSSSTVPPVSTNTNPRSLKSGESEDLDLRLNVKKRKTSPTSSLVPYRL